MATSAALMRTKERLENELAEIIVKTDEAIASLTSRTLNTASPDSGNLSELRDNYTKILRIREEIETTLCPGVEKLVAKLDQKDPVTGTCRFGESARAKIIALHESKDTLLEKSKHHIALLDEAVSSLQLHLIDPQSQASGSEGQSSDVAPMPQVIFEIKSIDRNREYGVVSKTIINADSEELNGPEESSLDAQELRAKALAARQRKVAEAENKAKFHEQVLKIDFAAFVVYINSALELT